MRPKTYSSEGIVLARKNYSEADRILSVFTKDYGRVSLLAKGVRKLKSRKRGHLEVFNHLRFSAAKGKGLDIITEAEIIDSYSSVRKNLRKISLAYYFMEVIGRVSRENEPGRHLFDLIIEYLGKLRGERKLKKLRLGFVFELLTLLGFWPKGKTLADPDAKLEEVIERQLTSVRVGKRLVT